VKLSYSTAAHEDLAELIHYGNVNFGFSQSNRYVERLRKVVDRICRSPEIARLRLELKRPVRIYPVGSHVIVYNIESDAVVIIRILHGRQDWQDHL
jgi:toxin ParE1/3/4